MSQRTGNARSASSAVVSQSLSRSRHLARVLDQRHRAVRVLVLVVELIAALDLERLRQRGLRLVVGPRVLEAVGNPNEDAIWLLAADRPERVDLAVDEVAGLQTPLSRIDVELEIDRREDGLADVGAHRREDLEDGAAGLAAHDREDRLALRFVGRLVDDREDVAVALVDPPGPVGGAREFQSVQRDITEVPLVDPHRDDALAVVVRRVLVEVAGTAGVAVAVLVPSPLEGPRVRHFISPFPARIGAPESFESMDLPFIRPESFEFMPPPLMSSMRCIAFIAWGESGSVRPGTLAGVIATDNPRTSSKTAMPRFAIARHGRSFSAAISAATKAIQPRLITPSANSAAMSAQQQPTHQPPCSTPTRSAPNRPGRQRSIRNMNGLRQWRRQVSLSGVSW